MPEITKAWNVEDIEELVGAALSTIEGIVVDDGDVWVDFDAVERLQAAADRFKPNT